MKSFLAFLCFTAFLSFGGNLFAARPPIFNNNFRPVGLQAPIGLQTAKPYLKPVNSPLRFEKISSGQTFGLRSEQGGSFPKNNVKVYLLGMAAGDFRLGYERFLGERFSLSLQGSYYNFFYWPLLFDWFASSPANDFVVTVYGQDDSKLFDGQARIERSNSTITGWSISPEARFYWGKNPRPRGGFVGVYFTYRPTNMVIDALVNGSKRTYEDGTPIPAGQEERIVLFDGTVTEKVTMTSFGITLGRQWVFADLGSAAIVSDLTFNFGLINYSFGDPTVVFRSELPDADDFDPVNFLNSEDYKEGKRKFEEAMPNWLPTMGLNWGIGLAF